MTADTLPATSPVAVQAIAYPVAVTEVCRAWEMREKLSQVVEAGERVEHRPLGEIMADLASARTERERADAALAKMLAGWGCRRSIGAHGT